MILAVLVLFCGFLSGVLVGVMVTCWWMRPCQAAFKVAKPTGASQSSEMDLQDSPAVEEVPSHPDISTGPVTPEMQAYFKEADKKRAHEKGLFVAGGLAFKTFDCTGNGKPTWYCPSDVNPGQSYCRPCLVCGHTTVGHMVWVCSFPCQVYHTRRDCGRLKCARHVTSVGICQCQSCCDFWPDR